MSGLEGCGPRGHRGSDTTEQQSMHARMHQEEPRNFGMAVGQGHPPLPPQFQWEIAIQPVKTEERDWK